MQIKAAAEHREARVTAWILLPFLLAMAFALGTRIERATWAIRDIDSVAAIVLAKAEARRPGRCAIGGEDIQPIVTEAVAEQFGQQADRNDELRYRAVVQTVANHLRRVMASPAVAAAESPCQAALPIFSAEVRAQVHPYLAVVALCAIVVVLVFPALFIAGYARARRELAARAARPGPFGSHADEVTCLRNGRLLTQKTRYFWSRFGFAMLIAFGVDYLFAPLGLRASTVGDYTTLNPIPGAKSYPFWAEQAQNASPVAMAFLGYALYAVTAFFDRFVRRELDDRIFLSLITRGVSVLLLALMLTGVTDGDDLSRALIFIAGVFPKTALEGIARIAKVTVERINNDEVAGFEVLPELNLSKQVALRDLGINDVYDLARADLRELVVAVGMSPSVLLRAADRALLIHAFGVEGAQKLAALPAYTATELVLFVRGGDERKALLSEALGVRDASLQLGSLEEDPNVRFLLEKRERYGSY